MTAANYMVDKDSQDTYNDNAQYVSANEFSRDELKTAIEYIKNNSNGKKFLDTYKEEMNAQNYFTTTPKQFNNSNYTPNTTQGEDTSLTVFPMTSIGTKLIGTTAVITKATNSKIDDIVLNTGIKADSIIQNKVVPVVKEGYYKGANELLKDPTKYTQGGLDAVESALPGVPAVTKAGGYGWTAEKIYNYENTLSDIENTMNTLTESVNKSANNLGDKDEQ